VKPGDHPEFFRFPSPPGTSRESRIRLDRDGKFWSDGDPVDHPRLEAALHSWIARHPDDGRPILTNGYDWTYFTVDDAPFVVRACEVDAEGHVTLALSNDDRVPLEPDTLEEADDGALYAQVTVKGERWPARFSRYAQAGLAPALIEEDGRVGLRGVAGLVVPRRRALPLVGRGRTRSR
jgi:hypothetical protein